MSGLRTFFATHPVFTVEEFEEAVRDRRVARQTRANLLHYHRRLGRIVPVRRGLYASVPPGVDAATFSADPHLVASRLAPDAVLGYHTALEVHGVAYSAHTRVVFVTEGPAGGAFTWRGTEFQRVRHPAALRRAGRTAAGTGTVDRSGLSLRVTTLERTVVDVLDRLDLGGGWEEVWRSLESVEYLDLDEVVQYALLLDNATTVAKVGLLLEQRRDALSVSEGDLDLLRARAPRGRHYLDRTARERGRLVPGWNLVVPERILAGVWEEWDG